VGGAKAHFGRQLPEYYTVTSRRSSICLFVSGFSTRLMKSFSLDRLGSARDDSMGRDLTMG
jgi:hypothetical protein